MMEGDAALETNNGIVECKSNASKKRSVAWDHFERNKDEGKAKCKHCDIVMAATPRSGTSHLKRHVERCSKRLILDVKPISVKSRAGELECSIDVDCIVDRRKTSMVWYEFEELESKDSEQRKAQCKHCQRVLSNSAKNGTSHLKRHLQKCPKRPAVPFGIKRYFPLAADEEPAEGSNVLWNSELEANELQRNISLFIIGGGHPFRLVEERGFRRMMSKAYPQFKPVSQSTIKRGLFLMYVKERDNVKDLLTKAPGRLCLVINSWKSRDTEDEYISISAQFIDAQWKLHRRILCLRAVAPNYDGAVITDAVAHSLSQWSIENKIFSISVDFSLLNESVSSSLLTNLLSKRVPLTLGSFPNIHCYSHVLTLIARSVLELIEGVLDKARDLVKYINRSSIQRMNFFDLARKKFHLQARKKLHLDTPSRWNSTYKFLDHVLYYRDVFLDLEGCDHHLRSEEDWKKMSTVHKFLKTLYDVTHTISDTTCPTANVYLKSVMMVHCRMLEIAKATHCLLTDTVRKMQEKFDDYWSQNSLILSCAAILDPRYKLKFVEYCYMKLYGSSSVSLHVSKVVNALYCLFAEYKHCVAQKASPPPESSGCSTNLASVSDDGDVFGDYNQFLNVTSRSHGNKSELDLYLEEPSYDLNCDLDVLEFWNNNATRYPELSVMARDILSIPASTLTSKFAFNIDGKILCATGGLMLPDPVQAFICLQDWLCATVVHAVEQVNQLLQVMIPVAPVKMLDVIMRMMIVNLLTALRSATGSGGNQGGQGGRTVGYISVEGSSKRTAKWEPRRQGAAFRGRYIRCAALFDPACRCLWD